MSSRRYLIITALVLIGLSVLTIVVNAVVDPYLMLGSERRDGFNSIKVDIGEHVRLSKAYDPTFRQWNTLLVGNSRIEMGLDPNHTCFKTTGAAVYNMGIPGAGVRQQMEYALNIMHEQSIKQVYLSIDFVDFLVPSDSSRPSEQIDWNAANGRLQTTFIGSPNPEYRWQSLVDRYQGLFSLDALKSSLRTVFLQKPGQPNRDSHGFNPANDFASAIALEGPSALFTQKMAALQNQYRKPWNLKYSDGSLSIDFEALAKFLEVSDNLNTKVTVFTNPFHQQFWDLLRDNELFELQAVWLEEVKKVIITSGSDTTHLWDFAGDSPYIHEQVPPAGAKSKPLQWFWEPSHYRSELGSLMLDAMLASECDTSTQFGQRLL